MYGLDIGYVRQTQLIDSQQFTVNKIIYKMFGPMAKGSCCEIIEYFGIPAVEQLITNIFIFISPKR